MNQRIVLARRWSLRTWVIWAILTSALVTMVAVVGGGTAIVRLSQARANVVDRLDPALRSTLDLTNAMVNEETGVRGFVLSARDDFLTPYTAGRVTEDAAARQLRSAIRDRFPQATRDLDAALTAASRWRAEYAEPTIAAVTASRAAGTADVDAGKQLFDNVRGRLGDLRTTLTGLQGVARRQLANTAAFLQWTGIAIAVLLLVGVLALAHRLTRGVTRPLIGLTAHVRRVAGGDYQHEINANGPAEVITLGADVDTMRQRILADLAALREVHATLDAQAQDLQRSNAELEQFAYVASHDLQEPLRKVASFCQLLEQRYRDKLDDRGKQYIDFAVDGAIRMQSLINDLLAFSRVGRLGSEQVPVPGDRLFAAATTNLADAIAETGAVVEADPLPTVNGDAVLLTSVLQNLIGNGLKFRDPQRPPVVRLTVTEDGDEWLFALSDNGIGVEPEYADRIFVIFQRLHAKSSYPGTGIGLAMCRKIIEYHGGRIWLDTEPRGTESGSRFLFTLPKVDIDQTTALAAESVRIP